MFKYSIEAIDRVYETCVDHIVEVLENETYFDPRDVASSTPLLGSGATGRCFLTEHEGKKLVLKFFLGDEDVYVHAMRNEIVKLSRVCGTGMQKLVGVFPEYLVLVTEYAGKALLPYMREGHCSVTERFTIMRQVASALDRLHQGGLVHLSLKPNNICVTRNQLG